MSERDGRRGRIQTPRMRMGGGAAPPYPEDAVAFLQVRSTRGIAVPRDADPYDDKPPDAEVSGAGDTWRFSDGAAIPASLFPESAWEATYDSVLPVDEDGEPVGHSTESEREPAKTDAERALEQFQREHTGSDNALAELDEAAAEQAGDADRDESGRFTAGEGDDADAGGDGG